MTRHKSGFTWDHHEGLDFSQRRGAARHAAVLCHPRPQPVVQPPAGIRGDAEGVRGKHAALSYASCRVLTLLPRCHTSWVCRVRCALQRYISVVGLPEVRGWMLGALGRTGSRICQLCMRGRRRHRLHDAAMKVCARTFRVRRHSSGSWGAEEAGGRAARLVLVHAGHPLPATPRSRSRCGVPRGLRRACLEQHLEQCLVLCTCPLDTPSASRGELQVTTAGPAPRRSTSTATWTALCSSPAVGLTPCCPHRHLLQTVSSAMNPFHVRVLKSADHLALQNSLQVRTATTAC